MAMLTWFEGHKALFITIGLFILFFGFIGTQMGVAEFPPPEREVDLLLRGEEEEQEYVTSDFRVTFDTTEVENWPEEFDFATHLETEKDHVDEFDEIKDLQIRGQRTWFPWLFPTYVDEEYYYYDASDGLIVIEEGILEYDYDKFYLDIEARYLAVAGERTWTLNINMFNVAAIITFFMIFSGVLTIVGTNILGTGLDIPHSYLVSLFAFIGFMLYLAWLLPEMFSELPFQVQAILIYPPLILMAYTGLTEISK